MVNTLPEERMDKLAASVVERIIDRGGRAIKVPADVSVPADVDRMVASAEAEFGDVDILVANAAFAERCPWHEITVEQWDRTMAVNVRGTFLCSTRRLPRACCARAAGASSPSRASPSISAWRGSSTTCRPRPASSG